MLLELRYNGTVLEFEGDDELGEFEVLLNLLVIRLCSGDEFLEFFFGAFTEPAGLLKFPEVLIAVGKVDEDGEFQVLADGVFEYIFTELDKKNVTSSISMALLKRRSPFSSSLFLKNTRAVLVIFIKVSLKSSG